MNQCKRGSLSTAPFLLLLVIFKGLLGKGACPSAACSVGVVIAVGHDRYMIAVGFATVVVASLALAVAIHFAGVSFVNLLAVVVVVAAVVVSVAIPVGVSPGLNWVCGSEKEGDCCDDDGGECCFHRLLNCRVLD